MTPAEWAERQRRANERQAQLMAEMAEMRKKAMFEARKKNVSKALDKKKRKKQEKEKKK